MMLAQVGMGGGWAMTVPYMVIGYFAAAFAVAALFLGLAAFGASLESRFLPRLDEWLAALSCICGGGYFGFYILMWMLPIEMVTPAMALGGPIIGILSARKSHLRHLTEIRRINAARRARTVEDRASA